MKKALALLGLIGFAIVVSATPASATDTNTNQCSLANAASCGGATTTTVPPTTTTVAPTPTTVPVVPQEVPVTVPRAVVTTTAPKPKTTVTVKKASPKAVAPVKHATPTTAPVAGTSTNCVAGQGAAAADTATGHHCPSTIPGYFIGGGLGVIGTLAGRKIFRKGGLKKMARISRITPKHSA